jgi:hypothetical protein
MKLVILSETWLFKYETILRHISEDIKAGGGRSVSMSVFVSTVRSLYGH